MGTVTYDCALCGAPHAVLRKSYNQAEARGQKHFCSHSCAATYSNSLRDQRGSNNPNWKGGISRDNYHYKKLQVIRYPERVKARELVQRAIRARKLEKQPCEVCGDQDSYAHHEDYARPLDVDWLCRRHHMQRHCS